MTYNKTPIKAAGIVAGLMPVRFEYTDPTASTVFVAGTFNDWQPKSKALYSSGIRVAN